MNPTIRSSLQLRVSFAFRSFTCQINWNQGTCILKLYCAAKRSLWDHFPLKSKKRLISGQDKSYRSAQELVSVRIHHLSAANQWIGSEQLLWIVMIPVSEIRKVESSWDSPYQFWHFSKIIILHKYLVGVSIWFLSD
jgi:hypothetical protein